MALIILQYPRTRYSHQHTRAVSAFHPLIVDKSSTSFGWCSVMGDVTSVACWVLLWLLHDCMCWERRLWSFALKMLNFNSAACHDNVLLFFLESIITLASPFCLRQVKQHFVSLILLLQVFNKKLTNWWGCVKCCTIELENLQTFCVSVVVILCHIASELFDSLLVEPVLRSSLQCCVTSYPAIY